MRRSLESDHPSCLPASCGVWLRRNAAPLWLRDRPDKWIKLSVDDWLSIQPDLVESHFNRLIGPAVAGAIPWVPSRSLYNRLNAIFFRVMRRLPYLPQPGIWEFAWRAIAPEVLRGYLSLLSFMRPQPWEQWFAERPSERKQPMLDAKLLYDQQGLTQKMAEFHAFLKDENMFCASKTDFGLADFDDGVARLIQGPHDVTHVIGGPNTVQALKNLKATWTWQDSLYYASDTPIHLDEWLQLATCIHAELTVFWCDYTMFDSSFSPPAWDFVEKLYGPLLQDADFRRVLKMWRMPFGKCGNDIKYQGGTMNASGRDDTAFANGVLNGVAMFASATAAWYDVPVVALSTELLRKFAGIAKIAVCGDDSLGFLPFLPPARRSAFLDRLRVNIALFGFSAKAFASNRIQDAVFLGHRPLRVAGRWFWTRTVGRALFKLGWQSQPKGDAAAHMTGVMDMHVICSPHVPILADIAAAWCAAHAGLKRTPPKLDPHKPWEWMTRGLSLPHYDGDTLRDMAAAYSVTRDGCRGDLPCDEVILTVADIQSAIDYVTFWAKTGLPHVLSHPVLKHMVWIDEQ